VVGLKIMMGTTMPAELVHLSEPTVSVLIDVSIGVPMIVHWGAPIGARVVAADVVALRESPILHGGLDVVAPLTLVPEHGSAFPGRPGLEGRRLDGSGWAPRFSYVSHVLVGNSLVCEAADVHAGLRMVSHIELHKSGVVTVGASVTNVGADRYDLDSLLLSLPVPGEAREMLTFGGRWSSEFRIERAPINLGVHSVENRSGRTSHGRVPFAIVGPTNFTESSKEVWAAHVGWSGNSVVQIEAGIDGRRRIASGELLLPGEIVLQPGESYATPTIYGAYSPSGTNGLSHAFHTFLRGRNGHPKTARKASLNTWEAVYFDHNLGTLKALADRAASIGMERYVLDDGWFHGRRDDRAGLGDWWVDETVWPNGLAPLIDYVIGLGMEFGIWVEPEMVNPNSDLYRAHPDWVSTDPGYEPVLGRNQLVLDMANEDVRNYLFEKLDALLRDHDVRYVKWDMNRDLVQASHERRASVHQQTLGLYELLDRLRAAHPNVEFETCASGGGRIDFAILERTVRAWTSDCQDALERQHIQRGFSYLFPPELMGAHVAAPRSHTTRRTQSLAFRCATAFFGHFGIEWNLLDTTDAELQSLGDFVALYKEHRNLLHSGDVYRFDHPNSAVYAHGVVSKDQSEAIVGFVQLISAQSIAMEPLRIVGLDPATRYAVSILPLPGKQGSQARRQPAWTTSGDGLEATGSQLSSIGLQMPVIDPEAAVVVRIKAIV
jgi:alpha-galactosidase